MKAMFRRVVSESAGCWPRFATVGAVTLVAAALRFPHLGRESLWLDEAYSVMIARLDASTFWRIIATREANMALYYVMLRGWLWFGFGEAAVRSLSAVAGTLAVPVLFVLGRRLLGVRAAFVSVLLLAANEFHIYYSQEARAYSLVALFVLLSCLFFVRGVEGGSRADWILYVAVSAAAVYCQASALLVLLAQLTSLLAPSSRRRPWRGLLASGLGIAAATAPFAWAVACQNKGGRLYWISPLSLASFYHFLLVLSGSRPAMVVFLAAVAAALAALARSWRRGVECEAESRLAFLVCWLLVPIAITLAVSLRKPIFADRYLIVCLPALLLLAGWGLARLRPPWAAPLLLTILLVATARHLVANSAKMVKDDWRGATGSVLAQTAPGDGLIFELGPCRLPFDYYTVQAGRSDVMAGLIYPDEPTLEANSPPDLALFKYLAGRYPRIWLIEGYIGGGA